MTAVLASTRDADDFWQELIDQFALAQASAEIRSTRPAATSAASASSSASASRPRCIAPPHFSISSPPTHVDAPRARASTCLLGDRQRSRTLVADQENAVRTRSAILARVASSISSRNQADGRSVLPGSRSTVAFSDSPSDITPSSTRKNTSTGVLRPTA